MKNYLELYTDYLMANASGYATATGLSAMTSGEISHDKITRFLSNQEFTSRDLWLGVKSMVRAIETEDGILIFDDTIEEKPYTKENDIVCWHFDHCKNRVLKGINILNGLYHSGNVSLPIAFEIVRKTIQYFDIKTGKTKRRSDITKNELMRQMIEACLKNDLKFNYILLDSWFSSKENFEFILSKNKHFVTALKDNRLMALSMEDKEKGRYVRVGSLKLSDKEVVSGWLKGIHRKMLFVRRVFKNKDGSTATLNLVCSDLSCNGEKVSTLYQKRWKIEEFHKSLKSNAQLAKSPARTVTTQNNHIFMAIYAVFKWECLKIKHQTNHFALRAKILLKATQAAYASLQNLAA